MQATRRSVGAGREWLSPQMSRGMRLCLPAPGRLRGGAGKYRQQQVSSHSLCWSCHPGWIPRAGERTEGTEAAGVDGGAGSHTECPLPALSPLPRTLQYLHLSAPALIPTLVHSWGVGPGMVRGRAGGLVVWGRWQLSELSWNGRQGPRLLFKSLWSFTVGVVGGKLLAHT